MRATACTLDLAHASRPRNANSRPPFSPRARFRPFHRGSQEQALIPPGRQRVHSRLTVSFLQMFSLKEKKIWDVRKRSFKKN